MNSRGAVKLRLLLLTATFISLASLAGWIYIGNNDLLSLKINYAESLSPSPAEQSSIHTIEEFSNADDTEKLLDPDQQVGVFAQHLIRMANDFQKDLGIELHIIIARLDENNIGIQVEKLFNHRKIGSHTSTGGILIFIDPGRKQSKIEVSHSLEGVLTDSTVGLIAKNQLSPYASYNAIGMALMDTLHFIKNYLYLASLQGRLLLDKSYTLSRTYTEKREILSGGAGAFAKIKDMSFDRDWKRPLTKSARSQYQPATDPIKSAEAYVRVLKNIIGDPSLELFTVESNIMRGAYPVAPFEYLERYRKLEKSRPFSVIKQGNYAVVTSSNPAHGFTPVLLKRIDKLWRVDMVELWKNLFFDAKGKYYLRNSNTPYRFGLAQFGKGKPFDVAALDIPHTSIHEKIQGLAQQDTALSHFKLAEIYFRNTFTALDALDQYEQAIRLAPNDPQFAEVLAQRYIHLYFPEAAIPLLQKQGRVALLKLTEAYALAQDYENSEKTARQVLDANPYSIYALRWLAWNKKKKNQQQAYQKLQKQINSLQNDPDARSKFVWLSFYPKKPNYVISNTVKVGDTTVYGHSEFSVTMTNHSKRDVHIKHIILRSRGDSNTSGLGDIKSYFKYSKENNRLLAGESVSFNKVWGFTTPTANKNMTYDFELCWQGVDDSRQQCEVQRLYLNTEDQS